MPIWNIFLGGGDRGIDITKNDQRYIKKEEKKKEKCHLWIKGLSQMMTQPTIHKLMMLGLRNNVR
jgi:hypothetical protein